MTLTEALDMRLRQAALVGWRLGARRQIEVTNFGVTLTLNWLDDRHLAPAESSELHDLPEGVKAFEWAALPDTRDIISEPDPSDIRAAAKMLGNSNIDCGKAADRIIYWLR